MGSNMYLRKAVVPTRYHSEVLTWSLYLKKPLSAAGFTTLPEHCFYKEHDKTRLVLLWECYMCLTVKNVLVNILFPCKEFPLAILTGKEEILVVVLPWFSESRCHKDLVWSRCELWLDHRKAHCKGLHHQTGGCPCCLFRLSSWSPHLKENEC